MWNPLRVFSPRFWIAVPSLLVHLLASSYSLLCSVRILSLPVPRSLRSAISSFAPIPSSASPALSTVRSPKTPDSGDSTTSSLPSSFLPSSPLPSSSLQSPSATSPVTADPHPGAVVEASSSSSPSPPSSSSSSRAPRPPFSLLTPRTFTAFIAIVLASSLSSSLAAWLPSLLFPTYTKFQRQQIDERTMKPPNPDKIKPAIPDNGLSIIERIFYNSAPGRPQVIMGIIFRMRCPKQVPELRLQRVLDIVRLAAAQHYRLCVSINPETMTTYSLAQTADQLPIISRAVVDDGNDNWKEVVKEEINTNFDINDPKLPLWKCCIVGSKELVETGKQRHSSPLADAKGKGVDRSGAGVPPAKSASAFDLEVVHDSLDNLVEAESPPSPTFTMSRWSLGRWRNHFRSKNDSTKVVDGIIKHGSFHHDAMDDGAPSFYVMFSFHHCLGDGLSMLAYARTFSEFCDDAHFNPDNLHLENIPVAQSPPPILDNLFDPNVFEVLPAATAMAFNFLKKKPKDRIKGRTLSMLVNEQGDFELDPDDDDDFKPTPKQIDFAQYQQQQQQQLQQQQQSPTEMGPSTVVVAPTAVGQTVTFAAATAQPAPSSSASSSATAGQVVVAAASHSRNRSNPQTLIVSPMKPLRNYTNVRQIWFDSDFTSILRKRAKAERTTIAAVLIVTALGAVRTSFSKLPKYRHRPLPNHQGWVITSSVRFLIPGSNLMNGGDRASDPALRVFGGYGGSIMNANMAYDDYHDFWERCRAVSRSIRTSFRASISRMKLVNYAYRHPKLWKWIESKADLAKLSRSYSVELANIGAWDYPMAPPNADDSDSRLRCDYFGGVVNSSFDGVRGLYTLGVVTLGGNMSVSCAYDVSAVHEVDADNFQKNFSEIMRAIAACEGKISVGKAREQA